jgi:hypothetical protein
MVMDECHQECHRFDLSGVAGRDAPGLQGLAFDQMPGSTARG